MRYTYTECDPPRSGYALRRWFLVKAPWESPHRQHVGYVAVSPDGGTTAHDREGFTMGTSVAAEMLYRDWAAHLYMNGAPLPTFDACLSNPPWPTEAGYQQVQQPDGSLVWQYTEGEK